MQSLLRHFEEIELTFKVRDTDIPCITETWLHTNIKQYHEHSKLKFTDVMQALEVVCIYVRDTIKSNKISTAINNTAVEGNWVTVQSNMHPSILVGTKDSAVSCGCL